MNHTDSQTKGLPIVRVRLETDRVIGREPVDTQEKAVEYIKNAKPSDCDLVLMDVQMPIMDGYEATRQIRKLDCDMAKVPIIAMTANAFADDQLAAIEAGMNEHVAKPVNVNKLKEVLSRFL